MCGCGGQCGACGMSGLLGGLMLPGGSTIRSGLHLGAIVNFFSWSGTAAIEQARQAIEDCLWGSGIFGELSVQLLDMPTENYLLVAGRTNYDFADKDDVSGAIQDAIQSCGVDVTIKSRDAVAVDSIPENYANVADVAQPGDYRGAPRSPSGSKCDWNSQTLGDYLACQFGVTTEKAVLIGAGLAVVAAVVIGKALR